MSQGHAKQNFANPGWQDYTPTLTNITEGNGTLIARYQQIGTTVHVYFHFTMGSTSAMGSNPKISMPVAEASDVTASTQTIGTVWILDSGTANYMGLLRHRDTATFQPLVNNTASTYATATNLSATVPMTWTTSDVLSFEATYEAAASELIGLGKNNDHGSLSGLTDDDHTQYPVYGEWADYTPTWTNVTVGNGTVVARYTQIGKTVHGRVRLTLGSTSSISGDPQGTLPVAGTSEYVSLDDPIGIAHMQDGTTWRNLGFVSIFGDTKFNVRAFDGVQTYTDEVAVSSSVPFTWASGDMVSLVFTYEAATAI